MTGKDAYIAYISKARGIRYPDFENLTLDMQEAWHNVARIVQTRSHSMNFRVIYHIQGSVQETVFSADNWADALDSFLRLHPSKKLISLSDQANTKMKLSKNKRIKIIHYNVV